jgi:hypothetical protein
VTVRGNSITFEHLEAAGGFTRRWIGRVDQEKGVIGFIGSDAIPPTPNYLTIVGDYRAAVIDSKFCGPGLFKILK